MSPRPASVTAVIAGAGLALVVACGAQRNRAETSPRADAGLLGARPDDVHAQITELSDRIEADRLALGIEAPTASAAAAMADLTAAGAAVTCTRSTRDTCVDVCGLGDSICANASAICDLAAQLPGDSWAAERCNAGKASCQIASERCCSC